MTKRLAIGTVCALAALVTGCHRGAPQGQVAATVNGEEITLQEVNTELQAQNIPDGADKQAAQRQTLQRIIERKLLLSAARDKKVDKSPDYLSQKQRTDEILLASTYARQQLTAVPVPTTADLNKFMADHANAFANRQALRLDQIRFRPTSADLPKLKIIQGDHSLEAVAQHLTGLGIKFDRLKAGADSAQLPVKLMQAIDALPPGEPFVVPTEGILTVNVLLGRQPIKVDPTQERQAAVSGWRQQQFTKLVTDQIKDLRNKAKITYQTGFAPDPATKAATGQ